MLLNILAILAGFALLVWGAERFISGAAALARNLGISPLLIGLTVVGLGTSAPEILVSTMASLNGNPSLAIGNAIGSNIANIALILGVTALIVPLTVNSTTLKREYPLLLAITLISLVLMLDGDLIRMDGVILLACLVVVFFIMYRIGVSSQQDDPMDAEYAAEIPANMSTKVASGWLAVGLLVLLGSSKLLVWGAVNIAVSFGVSDLVIGLTIIALGTSLPELAACIAGALKNEHDIVIGNIIGSNIYNLVAVLSMPALIAPSLIPPEILSRDMPVMIALTLALFVMAYGFRGQGRINRLEASVLVISYLGYQGFLLYQTAQTI